MFLMHIYCPLLLLFLLNSELGFCEFPIIQKTESPPKIIDITNTIPHISFPLDAVDIVFCMSLPPCPPSINPNTKSLISSLNDFPFLSKSELSKVVITIPKKFLLPSQPHFQSRQITCHNCRWPHAIQVHQIHRSVEAVAVMAVSYTHLTLPTIYSV